MPPDDPLAHWKFNPLERWMNKSDPVESEFFTSEGQPDALIRETVQNSLDAGSSGPVRVRFAFREVENGTAAGFLKNLAPHLEAQEFLDDLPLSDRVSYLAVEDFGTRGLVGDPLQDEDADERAGRNDFYWFWRNTGRSQKRDTDLGRWGLGKRVLSTSSRILSFWGLTCREDSRRLLMGLSVLKVHRLSGRDHYPYGYFGQFEDDGFPLPVEKPAVIESFASCFSLHRDSQSGLSLVIPWPKPELTPEELIRSTVRHYFYPILRGRLEVVVSSPEEEVTINRDSLRQVVGDVNWGSNGEGAQLQDLFDFAEEAQRLHDSEMLETLDIAGVARAPLWSADLIPEESLPELRRRFEVGEMVAIQVPVTVRKKGGDPAGSDFEVFLRRDAGLRGGELTFVRQGITISGIRRSPKPGIRALVVAENPGLAELLGDSENPAHTEWLERADRLKRNFDYGPYTVRFVTQSAGFLADQLTASAEGRDRDLLSEVFFIPEPPQPEEPEEPVSDHETTDEPVVEVEGSSAKFRTNRIDGGFSLIGTDSLPLPCRLEVRMAYDVRRGNPFKRYTRWDFSVDEEPVQVGTKDCALLERSENRIVVRPDEENFRVEVRGFDAHRDLRVRVQLMEDGS